MGESTYVYSSQGNFLEIRPATVGKKAAGTIAVLGALLNADSGNCVLPYGIILDLTMLI